MIKIITAAGSKQYPILINDFTPSEVVKILVRKSKCDKFFIVIDENIYRLHRNYINELLLELGRKSESFIVNSGERSKSFMMLTKMLDSMLAARLSRHSAVVAIGGGVTGDISAFAASIFMRGIKVYHLPTTLISAVDSAVGGKTGINFNKKKNIVGSFYQPDGVIINQSFLKTLPQIELKSGLGEIIKYALLSDKTFFTFVNSNYEQIKKLNVKILIEVIRKCLLIKTSVVQSDERESSLRKILNLGHTFGHAIESASKFKVKHGLAVTAGLFVMTKISNNLKILTDEKFDLIMSLLLKNLSINSISNISDAEFLHYLEFDKKNYNGKINCILIKDLGEVLIDFQLTKLQILNGFHYLKSP